MTKRRLKHAHEARMEEAMTFRILRERNFVLLCRSATKDIGNEVVSVYVCTRISLSGERSEISTSLSGTKKFRCLLFFSVFIGLGRTRGDWLLIFRNAPSVPSKLLYCVASFLGVYDVISASANSLFLRFCCIFWSLLLKKFRGLPVC